MIQFLISCLAVRSITIYSRSSSIYSGMPYILSSSTLFLLHSFFHYLLYYGLRFLILNESGSNHLLLVLLHDHHRDEFLTEKRAQLRREQPEICPVTDLVLDDFL